MTGPSGTKPAEPIRIWFQKHTAHGVYPLLDQMYQTHLSRLCGADAEVAFHTLPKEAYDSDLPAAAVRFGAVEVLFAQHFWRSALRAEEGGYDAFVIGTSQDPGLREARALAGIPVLGYGETAFFWAASSGVRFGIVGFIPELREILEENIERYGLSRWYRGAAYLLSGRKTMSAALSGDSDSFLTEFTSCVRDLAARGAQVIIPGEGLPNEALVALGVTRVDGVPIIDADGLLIRSAIQQAELTRAGVVARPTEGYWFRRPESGVLRRLDNLLRHVD